MIFDLNGTVVEIFKKSEYERNLKDMAGVLGLDLDRFKEAWHVSWMDFPYGNYPSVEHRLQDALDHYGKKVGKAAFDEAVRLRMAYILGQHSKIYPGVLGAFQWALDNGYKLGMVSNCSTETAVGWKDNPLSAFIPEPTLSCSVRMKKPEPEIFLHELEKLRVAPGRCIYFADGDDHEFDVAAALGMTCVLVTYEVTDDIFRHEPFPSIETKLDSSKFNELPALVESLEQHKMENQ